MGRRGSNGRGKGTNSAPGSRSSMTIREASAGKKQHSVNAKSMLKLDHIKKLAVWANDESSIPSLGAFFGRRLASCAEALGVPPDPSFVSCQRCESILQPGYNCTIRVEKSRQKAGGRRKRSGIPLKNNVVYKCNFCSHPNMKRGASRSYKKDIRPPKPEPPSQTEPTRPVFLEPFKSDNETRIISNDTKNTVPPLNEGEINPAANDSPATPAVKSAPTLLDSKRRKRNRSGGKKVVGPDCSSAMSDAENTISSSSKPKRKSWTTLREIAESSQRGNSRIFSSSIPFSI